MPHRDLPSLGAYSATFITTLMLRANVGPTTAGLTAVAWDPGNNPLAHLPNLLAVSRHATATRSLDPVLRNRARKRSPDYREAPVSQLRSPQPHRKSRPRDIPTSTTPLRPARPERHTVASPTPNHRDGTSSAHPAVPTRTTDLCHAAASSTTVARQPDGPTVVPSVTSRYHHQCIAQSRTGNGTCRTIR